MIRNSPARAEPWRSVFAHDFPWLSSFIASSDFHTKLRSIFQLPHLYPTSISLMKRMVRPGHEADRPGVTGHLADENMGRPNLLAPMHQVTHTSFTNMKPFWCAGTAKLGMLSWYLRCNGDANVRCKLQSTWLMTSSNFWECWDLPIWTQYLFLYIIHIGSYRYLYNKYLNMISYHEPDWIPQNLLSKRLINLTRIPSYHSSHFLTKSLIMSGHLWSLASSCQLSCKGIILKELHGAVGPSGSTTCRDGS